MLLQPNRDLCEASDDLTGRYRWNVGLPDLDALLLRWRWPILSRHTTACGRPGHTCDLHRQAELLHHYTHQLGTPTILWDKDRRLPAADPLRRTRNVTVCEPALHPTPGAVPLLFPVADTAIDAAGCPPPHCQSLARSAASPAAVQRRLKVRVASLLPRCLGCGRQPPSPRCRTLPCKGGSMDWALADRCRRVALASRTLLSCAGGSRPLLRASPTSC